MGGARNICHPAKNGRGATTDEQEGSSSDWGNSKRIPADRPEMVAASVSDPAVAGGRYNGGGNTDGSNPPETECCIGLCTGVLAEIRAGTLFLQCIGCVDGHDGNEERTVD